MTSDTRGLALMAEAAALLSRQDSTTADADLKGCSSSVPASASIPALQLMLAMAAGSPCSATQQAMHFPVLAWGGAAANPAAAHLTAEGWQSLLAPMMTAQGAVQQLLVQMLFQNTATDPMFGADAAAAGATDASNTGAAAAADTAAPPPATALVSTGVAPAPAASLPGSPAASSSEHAAPSTVKQQRLFRPVRRQPPVVFRPKSNALTKSPSRGSFTIGEKRSAPRASPPPPPRSPSQPSQQALQLQQEQHQQERRALRDRLVEEQRRLLQLQRTSFVVQQLREARTRIQQEQLVADLMRRFQPAALERPPQQPMPEVASL